MVPGHRPRAASVRGERASRAYSASRHFSRFRYAFSVFAAPPNPPAPATPPPRGAPAASIASIDRAPSNAAGSISVAPKSEEPGEPRTPNVSPAPRPSAPRGSDARIRRAREELAPARLAELARQRGVQRRRAATQPRTRTARLARARPRRAARGHSARARARRSDAPPRPRRRRPSVFLSPNASRPNPRRRRSARRARAQERHLRGEVGTTPVANRGCGNAASATSGGDNSSSTAAFPRKDRRSSSPPEDGSRPPPPPPPPPRPAEDAGNRELPTRGARAPRRKRRSNCSFPHRETPKSRLDAAAAPRPRSPASPEAHPEARRAPPPPRARACQSSRRRWTSSTFRHPRRFVTSTRAPSPPP